MPRCCYRTSVPTVVLVAISPGKLLDVDDQYYQQLSSSRPQASTAPKTPTPGRTAREGRSPVRRRSAGGRVREQVGPESESHGPDGDSRQVQQHFTVPQNWD